MLVYICVCVYISHTHCVFRPCSCHSFLTQRTHTNTHHNTPDADHAHIYMYLCCVCACMCVCIYHTPHTLCVYIVVCVRTDGHTHTHMYIYRDNHAAQSQHKKRNKTRHDTQHHTQHNTTQHNTTHKQQHDGTHNKRNARRLNMHQRGPQHKDQTRRQGRDASVGRYLSVAQGHRRSGLHGQPNEAPFRSGWLCFFPLFCLFKETFSGCIVAFRFGCDRPPPLKVLSGISHS